MPTSNTLLSDTLTDHGLAHDAATGSLSLPNTAPDEGLSAGFNSWFTLFGQFFDHGLDLVTKGGNEVVIVPLQPDDPLYVEGSRTNFMLLTRATQLAGPGADGVLGDDPATIEVNESLDDTSHEAQNTTTPFVDQNQTYTSHPSHQVFLREYVLDANGRPVATGLLLDNADNGGIPTWARSRRRPRSCSASSSTIRRSQRPAVADRRLRQFHPRSANGLRRRSITGPGRRHAEYQRRRSGWRTGSPVDR